MSNATLKARQKQRPTATTIYRKGKAVGGAAQESQESDSEEEQIDARGLKKPLTDVELAKRQGIVIQNDLDLDLTVEEAQPAAVHSRAKSSTATDIKEESSEYETDSSEEASGSSSEEEVAKPLFKPVFISKRNRDPNVVKQFTQDEVELAEIQRQADLELQRQQAHQLVGETVKRQMAEKQVKEVFPDVDDTDGLDPEGEFEAWKLRELQRLKRDADAILEARREKEELEARRALPEDVRLKEDLEHAKQTRESKQRGNQAFLQKYHHKGVFYTEDELMKRDYTGMIEDQVTDVASLPSIMQVRDFGKRSRTKHTHLKDVDTTKNDAGWGSKALGRRFGENSFTSSTAGDGKQMGNACFNCGKEGHMARDCPQPREGSSSRSSRPSRACFNCGEEGHLASECPSPKKARRDNGDRSASRREDRQGDWGTHEDVRAGQRQRSRSRSPEYRRRERSRSRDGERRRRSTSRDRNRDRDKRRRYD